MQGAERTGKARRRLAFAGRLASVLILSGILVLSDDQRAAIARALADPMAILEGRSPGSREGAALRQTKPDRRISPISEDLLEGDFAIPPEALELPTDAFTENSESPFIPAPTEASPAGPPVEGLPSPTLALHGGTSRFGGGGGGFFGVPGGGGGGDKDGGEESCKDLSCGISTGDPEIPGIPVPEPSTWLLVIAGFMSLGGTLRLVRKVQRTSMARGHTA